MTKILIIEDEVNISDLIKLNLDMVGFESVQAMDGEKGLKHIKEQDFDLVLLDVKLPGIDGYGLLPKILKRSIPVIFLTSQDALKHKVRGLESGADDYITKPFEGTELIARIKAVLRRKSKKASITTFANIKVDFKSRKVFRADKEIKLTLIEFKLLKYLLENKGIALSRENLLDLVWSYNYPGNTRTVDIHVQKLRSKLKTDKIVTVYKLGYRLED